MDNVSHTIAGMLIADAAIQLRVARGLMPSKWFGRTAFVSSAVANNLPDLDFLYSRITQPPVLGYLLHHRGHTHTLVAGVALSLLLLLGWRLLASRLHRGLAAGEWRTLVVLVLLGPVVHIAMDFTNNYGVHPFWPFYDGWLYGDFVFIIEPLFFAIGVPPLLFAIRSGVGRVLFAGTLAAVLGLAWAVPFVPIGVAALVTLVAGLFFWLGKTQSPARRVGFAFGAALAVVLTFSFAHVGAERLARASVPEGARVLDVALTPAPGNPLCFSVWRLTTQGGDYVAERGIVASFPALYPVERCRTEAESADPTAPIEVFEELEGRSARWTGRFRAPVRELSALAAQDCFAAAFLRYARLPFWKAARSGTVLGDLRYDRSPELEFAEFFLPLEAPCPRFVPSWTPPRHDLLH